MTDRLDHPLVHETASGREKFAPGLDPAAIDPNHHLWRNGRRWWIAFTVHRGHQQQRVRFSLGTTDLAEARRRRDEFLRLYAQAKDLKISIRFRPRSRSGVGRA